MEKTLVKGLRVLEAIATRKEPCGVSELAVELDLTKSNVYRLLQTLTATDYVNYNADSGTYRPSVKLLELGLIVGSHIDVRKVAQPILAQIVARTEENTSIGILEGHDVLFIDRVDSTHRLRAVVRNGERLPAHTSSCGKVLLAYAGDRVIADMRDHLTRATDRTITDFDAFRAQLAEIRAQGYYFSRGEWHSDISSVSVPIHGRNGQVDTALMVSGPTIRITDDTLPSLLEALKWGAAEISSLLP